jgi:hypothetical protein
MKPVLNSQNVDTMNIHVVVIKTCTYNRISMVNAQPSHCIIWQVFHDENITIQFTIENSDSSNFMYCSFSYAHLQQSIIYHNQTGQWLTKLRIVSHGCNWDYCSKLSLLTLVRESFQVRLNDSWLNSTILGNDEQSHGCFECTTKLICSITSFIIDSQSMFNAIV